MLVVAASLLLVNVLAIRGWRRRRHERTLRYLIDATPASTLLTLEDQLTPQVRAERFLLDHLSEAQRAEYLELGFFDVIGPMTRNVYRIHASGELFMRQHRVGRAYQFLCVHSMDRNLPPADIALAKKQMIEAFEPALLLISNSAYNTIDLPPETCRAHFERHKNLYTYNLYT